MNKFEEQRQYYPVLGYNTFLNSAQNGLIPTYASQAMTQYIEKRHVNALDVISMTQQWTDADDLRVMVADILNCRSRNILFGSSNSELFNLFSNGIKLEPGDNVVTYDCAYFTMTYTWFNKEETNGIEARIAESHDGLVTADDLVALCDERTKAMTICYVDFETGYRHDVAKLGEFCRKNGILLAVDATQAAGAMNIDVEAEKIDFLTSSTYKWMQCLLGLGFCYISDELLKTLNQSVMGWVGTVDKLNNDPMKLELCDEARKFETGGLSFVAMEGLKKTAANYLRLGKEDVEEYILSLVDYAYERASKLKTCRIVGDFPRKNRSGIVSVEYPEKFGINRAFLQRRNINAMPQGDKRTRLSIHYYNNKYDIDRFFDMLEEMETKYAELVDRPQK